VLSYVYVAIGSAAGGLARFAFGTWAQERWGALGPMGGGLPFPLGTLIVNVSGSFLLGLILVLVTRQQGASADALRLLFAVGFCGGYTTFSTFSADTVALIERGGAGLAALNVAASVGLALVGTFAGVALGRVMFERVS
jgi:CrcB protein